MFITTTKSITNTSDKHLLVGNCQHIIAAYETHAEAVADLDNKIPSIEDSPWGSVQIVAPGQTVSGEYCQPVPMTSKQAADFDSEWAKMPWVTKQA